MEIIIYGSNVLSMHVCVYNKHMYTTLHTQHVWWELNYMYMYMYTVVSGCVQRSGKEHVHVCTWHDCVCIHMYMCGGTSVALGITWPCESIRIQSEIAPRIHVRTCTCMIGYAYLLKFHAHSHNYNYIITHPFCIVV